MKRLREFCFDHHITALWQAPMSDYTSLRIGGKADAFLLPSTEGGLVAVISFLNDEGIPFCVIGNGTNLLVSDEGFRGVLISTRHIRSVTVNGTEVKAACGTPISVLERHLADHSLGGLEPLYGIPGTVGGAVYMNAGAYGTEIADRVNMVSVIHTADGQCGVLQKKDCRFGYRQSAFMQSRETAILSVELSLERRREAEVRESMRRYLSIRMEKQPTALPSAGSAFKRPDGFYAAKLIEEAGLSGLRVGGAAVSVKHTGFIVNLGDATARDVRLLMRQIKDTVASRFGVCLTSEIEYIDENGRIRDPLSEDEP